MEQVCLRARDAMLAQITQVLGEEDKEGRALMAEYLKNCLKEYVERDCLAPEFGEPFPPVTDNAGAIDNQSESESDNRGSTPSSESAVVVENGILRRGEEVERSGEGDGNGSKNHPSGDGDGTARPATTKSSGKMWGTGNFVYRRPVDDDDESPTSPSPTPPPVTRGLGTTRDAASGLTVVTSSSSAVSPAKDQASTTKPATTGENAMDWRRRRNMEASLNLPSSQNILQQLSEREHAPGIRRPGCPCCEPDSASTYADKMMLF